MLRSSMRVGAIGPRFARYCSFQTKLKEMEAAATKMAPNLPDGLKEIANDGASISAEITDFAAKRPELFKAVMGAIAEADKPGIRPSVDTPKDPNTCKYTQEGTMIHEMMQRVASSDRRMKVVGELEYTLSAADKEAVKAQLLEKAKEAGVDASAFNFETDIPKTMKIGGL